MSTPRDIIEKKLDEFGALYTVYGRLQSVAWDLCNPSFAHNVCRSRMEFIRVPVQDALKQTEKAIIAAKSELASDIAKEAAADEEKATA